MQPDRREFLKQLGFLTAAGSGLSTAHASDGGHRLGPEDPQGVLVDLNLCVGCRLCEHACKSANGFEAGPVESYDDQSVFKTKRRPAPDAHTVINAWDNPADPSKPVYAKVNCMHCNHAACVSACIVGALTKNENGAVTYDAWKCIGCRYCMVACPFQIPSYEYDNVLTPEVQKCEFCHDKISEGEQPACVQACPPQAMTFGKRNTLIKLAHRRIDEHPGQYVHHVYGEHEVGGTSWMYLSPIAFDQAGFLKLGNNAPGVLTEAIQHGVFKYWIAPVGWYGFLATMYWWTGRRARAAHEPAHTAPAHAHPHHHKSLVEEAMHLVAPRSLALAGFDADIEEDLDTPPEPRHKPHHEQKHDAPHAEAHHVQAAPVDHPLWTPGVMVLLAMVITGVAFGLYRFIFGLAASTNLDQQHPWGLWIAMDVGSGIALAGGGFVTAAVVHIFHREHYHAIARSALLTALLGYTFYVPGLLADIGRWYNIWHPTIPTMWQGNSVLFEVGLCVMIYLNVQYAELMPIVCQRLMAEKSRWPRIALWAKPVHDMMEKVMPALLILGVCLSTFHQSSLGNLMVITPWKLHALWWTPVSPILFLLSAMMVGFPMVIFTILFASWSLNRKPEMNVLAPLARYVPPVLGVYLAVKVGDMVVRKTYPYLTDGSYEGYLWIGEMVLGVVAPLVMLLVPSIRRSPKWLAMATLMVILGVVLNRLNCFILGYHAPYSTKTYIPSITEFAVSMGLVAALLLTYRVAVTYLPILEPQPKASE